MLQVERRPNDMYQNADENKSVKARQANNALQHVVIICGRKTQREWRFSDWSIAMEFRNMRGWGHQTILCANFDAVQKENK
jgi:hypothetical protein